MVRRIGVLTTAVIGCMAGGAFAQPVLIGLGASPTGVSNPQSGTYYISGNNVRWTLNAGALTYSSIGASGGGLISADGAYQTCSTTNGTLITGQTATGISPAWSIPATTTTAVLPAAAAIGARFTAAGGTIAGLPGIPNNAYGHTAPAGGAADFQCYGAGSSSNTVHSATCMSHNGRFIGLQSNISTFNVAAGTSIGAVDTFRNRPGLWDANTGATRLLPTPYKTTGTQPRRRDGTIWGVSDDGLVIVGAQEHNSATTPASTDPDGGRLVVWRWDGGLNDYVMSFLPNGVNGSGFPITYTTSVGSVWMNGAGTIIVGPAVENNGSSTFAAKWVWNAGTSTWDAPIKLGYMPNPTITITSIDGFTVTTSAPHGLAVNDWVYISGNSGASNNGWKQVVTAEDPMAFTFNGMVVGTGGTSNKGASWLPTDITSCTIAPQLFVTGMSDDGNTVVGFTKYSTCSSFMQGGWIWTASSGYAADWYDYLHAQNVAGTEPGASSPFGPVGQNGDYTKGMPRLGNPSGISPDGSATVGFQSGTQIIVGAPPWILLPAGSPSCVTPAITLNPSNQTYARCSLTGDVTQVILNAAAAGTAPLSYQWYRGATALSDGSQPSGSTITGANSFQLRISVPFPADNGLYHCVVTGCNGSSATTTDATVTNDATLPTLGDSCSSPIAINAEGSTAFNICGCLVNEGSSCGPSTDLADIWFRYTPTFTGDARFQTCGSSFDTTLQLLDGCGGNVLTCNNDVGARGLVGTSCNAQRSLISRYPVTAGVPIYIRVGMVSNPFNATGSLTISQAPAIPANDQCSNAQVVGLGLAIPFNLAEATDDYVFGADTCGASGNTFSNRDVWFRVNAPCGGSITVDTCGSTISNPMLHIMSDCNGSVLACNDNVGSGVAGCTSNQARISSFAVSGSVLIRVSASGTAAPNSGAGVLNITGTITPCCDSVDFNCDNDVGTDADIEAFFACLSGSCPAAPCTNDADFNNDGDVGTDGDIEAFFRVLAGGNC